MNDRRGADSGTRLVHFIFGALAGALTGLSIWIFWVDDESLSTGLMLIGGLALGLGILAAFFLDGFWKRFSGALNWLWPF